MEINVNDQCVLCGRCVRICPSILFSIEDKRVKVEPAGCIACGHCVGVCEVGAIEHSEFPPSKIHEIDYSNMPTPEQVFNLICARRSNRAFSKDAVPSTFVDLIVGAAHRAPTGSNAQNLTFTVVTDPEKIKQVAQITLDTFLGIGRILRNPFIKPILKLIKPELYNLLPMLDRMKARMNAGKDPILRGATMLIFFSAPHDSRLGVEDCNLAYQNGSLMAQSLGVSQFYLGFVLMAIRQGKKSRKIERALGIEGKINAGMGIGMPQFDFKNYIDRKAIDLKKI